MGSAGIYVCALAWTMLVHTKDVVLRGGMGLGYAFFLTEKQLYIGGNQEEIHDRPFCLPVHAVQPTMLTYGPFKNSTHPQTDAHVK